ncbi:hypothetical protein [Solibacillus sp. FSL K6-1523]|uniref:hypothetical protein n=1 Tax=Solibacillus sp. FSL K6-1523 TaxID=2921471 RepID=UPI0030FB4C7F
MEDLVTVETDFGKYQIYVQRSPFIDPIIIGKIGSGEIDGLAIRINGNFLSNVDFLKQLPNIKYLDLGKNNISDLSSIEDLNLNELEYLNFRGSLEGKLDLSSLSKLQDLLVLYDKKIKNLFTCTNLKRLVIHHYKNKNNNVEEFKVLGRLETLEIWSSPIKDIADLQGLRSLRRVELRYLPKLESISGIENNTSIKELWIQNCKKVNDWEVLGTLSNLKVLTIEACGNIPSLHFLDKLESLESIRLVSNTFIEDGKLSWLINKKSMKYFNTPIENHYDISIEALSKFNNFGIR